MTNDQIEEFKTKRPFTSIFNNERIITSEEAAAEYAYQGSIKAFLEKQEEDRQLDDIAQIKKAYFRLKNAFLESWGNVQEEEDLIYCNFAEDDGIIIDFFAEQKRMLINYRNKRICEFKKILEYEYQIQHRVSLNSVPGKN